MIFPTLSLLSNRGLDDPVGRIDRALHDRNHRLSAGVSISHCFDKVRGALVVSQGNGKYLRIRHSVGASSAIPKSLRDGCVEVVAGNQRNSGQIAQLQSELAELQASVVEQLKREAGKYVDRVLAVAVTDPGVWDQDFDGKMSYSPFCDATRLAELCGVTVIDAFPARDLAVGGRGVCLDSLPYWILFSDRDSRVADQTKTLVTIDDTCLIYNLPPSDGLDSDVPLIKFGETLGVGFLNEVTRRCFPEISELQLMDRIYADGIQVPDLRARWEAALQSQINSHSEIGGAKLPTANGYLNRTNQLELTKRLVDEALQYFQANPNSFSNVIRTGVRWVVDLCLAKMPIGKLNPLDQVIVACPAHYEAELINQFTELLDGVTVTTTRQSGFDSDQLSPVVAAILGLFNIDQMPANVPWLTGADCQRILGRLTPGRPSNWRQLVRVMADFQPAPMKLKDAI